jgi:hypothetical protein
MMVRLRRINISNYSYTLLDTSPSYGCTIQCSPGVSLEDLQIRLKVYDVRVSLDLFSLQTCLSTKIRYLLSKLLLRYDGAIMED